jgi:hypothetical protein
VCVCVSDIAHGEATAADAVARAIARCQQRRADRRIAAPCRTYGIGSEIVATEADPE